MHPCMARGLLVWGADGLSAALVGRLGTTPLAAVGVSTMPIIFFGVVFNFLLFLTTPAVARAVAKGDTDQVRSSFRPIPK